MNREERRYSGIAAILLTKVVQVTTKKTDKKTWTTIVLIHEENNHKRQKSVDGDNRDNNGEAGKISNRLSLHLMHEERRKGRVNGLETTWDIYGWLRSGTEEIAQEAYHTKVSLGRIF